MKWHLITTKKIISELDSDTKGLDKNKVNQKRREFGYNIIERKKKTSTVTILLNQFKSLLILLLLIATLFSLFLGNIIDAIVIFVIVLLNGLFGFIQDYKAEKAIEALEKMSPLTATVLRDGEEKKILAKELVPGDILLLSSGDKVPADARIIEEVELQVNESLLTGESEPVSKNKKKLKKDQPISQRKNMVFMNTSIVGGHCKAIVVAIGKQTQVGEIAKKMEETKKPETPLQKNLDKLSKNIGIIIIFVSLITLGLGLAFQTAPLLELIMISIALAVAAVPEGLPAVVTLSLGLGVQRMAKKQSIIRKLPAVETLGSVNIICTDKTGTLTKNKMTVKQIYFNQKIVKVGEKLSKKLKPILKAGLYCNNTQINKGEINGDPTEAALIVSAEKAGITKKGKRVDEIPFSSEKKFMATTHKINNEKITYYKGALSVILNKCEKILINGKKRKLTKKIKQNIREANKKMTSQSLRTLGFAFEKNNTTVFLGIQGMLDPPRKGVKEALKKCYSAGIRVIMITGDSKETAKAIADRIELRYENTFQGQLPEKIGQLAKKTNIFARISHKDKVRLVTILRRRGNIVAMTGDGVNDSLALKKAEIGISMGLRGTDVSKEASDMVLTNDHFATIVSAIKEGRRIFSNIRKFVNYLISCNIGEIFVVLSAFVAKLPLPITAIQLLWINLLTDGMPALALGVDPAKPKIMKEKPRSPKEKIINKRIAKEMFFMGIVIGLASFILFIQEPNLVKAQTIVFTSLVIFEVARLEFIRSKEQLSLISNKYLVLAILSSLALQLIVLYTPINIFFKTVPLLVMDWIKIVGMLVVLIISFRIYSKVIK